MFLRKIAILSIFSIFIIFITVYGFYKALPLILGPKIELASPTDGENFTGTTTISVRGTVYRARELYINGIPTAFTENGIFETKMAIYPPNNILIVEAVDKFKRKVSEVRKIGAQDVPSTGTTSDQIK